MISFLFWVILVTDVLINVDHGCIPAASIYIKKDLDLNNVTLGVLGSMVFLGLTIGKFVKIH